MTNSDIYKDIAARTGGAVMIGVVGPVRTGKSTFIKRFMDTLVIPNIEDEYARERARDELPQSGSGRTIMTAEPKFVPEEAVEIKLGNETTCMVRMVDCVGYMVPGASGRFEDGSERLVTTPWFDHEVTMTEAAELFSDPRFLRVSRSHLVNMDAIADTRGEAFILTDGTSIPVRRQGRAELRAAVEAYRLRNVRK